jgi:hypothetical protein
MRREPPRDLGRCLEKLLYLSRLCDLPSWETLNVPLVGSPSGLCDPPSCPVALFANRRETKAQLRIAAHLIYY